VRQPALLELGQQTVGAADGVGVAGHALHAAVLPLGHQSGAFQHGHVLLYGGKRHVVAGGQLGDGRLRAHDPRQDVAPRGVGERPEQVIEGERRRLTLCNHLVV
jgi:hypothetical protein